MWAMQPAAKMGHSAETQKRFERGRAAARQRVIERSIIAFRSDAEMMALLLMAIIFFFSLNVNCACPAKEINSLSKSSDSSLFTPNATAIIEGTLFEPDHQCIRWNYATHKIAYMQPSRNHYCNIYLANEDGSNESALTFNHPDLPGKHAGAEDWHPSGKYLVFVAEKAKHGALIPLLPSNWPIIGSSYPALPGFGGFSDLWLITADAGKTYPLRVVSNDYDHGILIPRFSQDGKKLVWAERIKHPRLMSKLLAAGAYVMKTADFVEQPTPHLENIHTYNPDGDAFYEVTAFTPDGSNILFSSNFETGNFLKSQLYSFNLAKQTYTRLTTAGYNEHQCISPDGKTIIYMSNWQNKNAGTDWWLMNIDGSNKRRITFMNKKGHEHQKQINNHGRPVWAGEVAWSPDGKWFYGDVQIDLIKQTGKIIKVRLPD